MNSINTSQLLMQMRAAAAQAQSAPQQAAGVAPADGGANFSSLLSQSIDKVNGMQQDAATMTKGFVMGSADVSLPEVMIAKSKASLAFEGMVQVRNKVVEAYQEIMRMQV